MPISMDWKLGLLQLIREIGESFTEPDDDWTPVLLIPGYPPVMVDFLDEKAKSIFAEIVFPLAIRASRANEYAFVSSVWMTRIDAPKHLKGQSRQEQMAYVQENFLPPSMSDVRKEAVMVTFGCGDGTCELWHAEIVRHANKPPELGEWEIYLSDADVKENAGHES